MKLEKVIVKVIKIYGAPFPVNAGTFGFDFAPDIFYSHYVIVNIAFANLESNMIIGSLYALLAVHDTNPDAVDKEEFFFGERKRIIAT